MGFLKWMVDILVFSIPKQEVDHQRELGPAGRWALLGTELTTYQPT